MKQVPKETSEEDEMLISRAYSFMRINTAVTLARGAYHKFENSTPQERLKKVIDAFHEALEDDKRIPQEVKENFLCMVTRYYKGKLEI